MNATWDFVVGDRVKSSPFDVAWPVPIFGTVTWLAKRPMCIMELGQDGFDMRVQWDGDARGPIPAFHGSVIKCSAGRGEQ